MARKFHSALAAALLVAAAAAHAHHSRAPFVLEETITFDAIVREVEWRSPHVYLRVAVPRPGGREEIWTLEGHSIAGFARLGWRQDSVKPGDQVRVVANPSRDPAQQFHLLDNVTLADGRRYYAFRIPPGRQVPGAQDRRPDRPSKDFSGTWNVVATMHERSVGGFAPPANWPLTELGQAQLAAFDLHDDPALDCVEVPMPRTIAAPYGHRWTRKADRIVLERELSGAQRIIHLDGAAPPPDHVPDAMGWSVGRFEGERVLVVETDRFAPTRWGSARGIDSSARKKITERYTLAEDGYSMQVSYTIEDPEFLTEPVTETRSYEKVADFKFIQEPCDPATARRHLEFE